MEDIPVLKECIGGLLRDVTKLDVARDLLHAELHATFDLIKNAMRIGPAAESAGRAMHAVYNRQSASIDDLDRRISELERQLESYTERFPDLVTQVTEELGAALEPEFGAAPGLKLGAALEPEFGAAPGLKLGAAPEPEDDPELVAALAASLESKQEEDEAYWARFGVRAWQPAPASAKAPAGARAHVSRLVVAAELRAAAHNQQPRAGVRALMAADEAFGLPSWPKGWKDRKP